nr:hypothetical protein [Tanacetum cinerariifolium]
MSPINSFPIKDLYMLEFSESLQENTGYWQEPNPHEYPVEQVATSPTKKNKPTRNRQKMMIQSMINPRKLRGQQSKRHKSSGSSSFNTEFEEANINLNTNVGDNNEDEVQEIRRLGGRDKARAAGKNKGSKTLGSSTMNDDALARLMVTEMTNHETEQREKNLEIKRREVECRERDIATQEYRHEQEDMRFYLHPYDHLTENQRKAMDEIKAKIKAKYNLQY